MKAFLVAAGLAMSGWAMADALVDPGQAKMAPKAEVHLPSLAGQSASLSDLKGKVVLLDFWASWCGPCRESFPWMSEMQDRYAAQGLEVVAVNLDQEESDAKQFLTQVPVRFTVLVDSQAQMPESFGLIGMPSSYLIDRQGRIRAEHIGFHKRDIEAYEQQIQTLLAE